MQYRGWELKAPAREAIARENDAGLRAALCVALREHEDAPGSAKAYDALYNLVQKSLAKIGKRLP